MISGQVSELIKLNTIFPICPVPLILFLEFSNPVNPVNPVNHNKVLRRSLILLFPVNVIVINRIIRINMISGQVSELIKSIYSMPLSLFFESQILLIL